MEKLVKVRLFHTLAGLGFAYPKGENEMPADRAAQFVSEGIAEYVDPPQTKTAQAPPQTTEKAVSAAAKTAEKR